MGVLKKVRPGLSLTVAVAFLEQNKANPRLIEEVKRVADRESKKDAVWEKVDEMRRVERQRSIFAMLPDCRSVEKLKEAIIQRAWDLLDGGRCEECDTLLEFVPSKDADKMLLEYFPDEDQVG